MRVCLCIYTLLNYEDTCMPTDITHTHIISSLLVSFSLMFFILNIAISQTVQVHSYYISSVFSELLDRIHMHTYIVQCIIVQLSLLYLVHNYTSVTSLPSATTVLSSVPSPSLPTTSMVYRYIAIVHRLHI